MNRHLVLIVDDTPLNLQVLGELLESSGYRIRVASNGQDALRLAALEPRPDLILLDVLMPGLDGFETCRHLKTNPGTKDIPVIFVSGTEDTKDRVRGFQVGGVDFISKPFLTEEVAARVGTHCRLTRIEMLEREIIGRQLAEASLRSEEEKYSAILKTAMDGFLILDMAGRIVEANDAYSAMSGYGLEELKTLGLSELEASFDQEQIAEHFEMVKSKGYSRFTTTHRRKDGTIFPIEVSVKYRTPEIGQVVAFIRDLTQAHAEEAKRKTMEECIARQQRMDAVGRLAGGIAHDFNNMLGVIIGHLEIAAYDLPSENPVQRDIQEALKASRRSAELTRQILTFARKQPVVHETIHLNQCAEPILKMLGRVLGEKIRLEWDLGAKLWPIRIAPSQVDQILTNLCLNAKDAISGEGSITVSTDNVELVGESCPCDPDCPEGDYVRLRIRDTGSGMDAATMSKSFEPFFTTKEIGKGTGLGLSMVEGIVKQACGFVMVESEPGRGTLFSLHFPKAMHPDTISTRTGTPASEATLAKTILLVEDEVSLLELTQTVLERMGCTVLAFRSPTEAIQSAKGRTDPLDLLISDVMMPVMNGPALLKEIHAVFPGLPYLFVSGHPTEIVSDAGIIPNGVAFLQKPFTRNQLASKIREVLSGASD